MRENSKASSKFLQLKLYMPTETYAEPFYAYHLISTLQLSPFDTPQALVFCDQSQNKHLGNTAPNRLSYIVTS